MNSVQLPPGVLPNDQAVVPWGEGRAVVPDPDGRAFMALAEFAREQKAKPMVGRPAKYQTAEQLGHACAEYFAWIDANPWLADKKQFAAKQGAWAGTTERKKIPYTIGGMASYLGISDVTWFAYAKREEFKDVCEWAAKKVREQKFAGAAAGFFNHSIIARDLGLVDKQEITGANGGPQEVITSEMTAEEAAERYARTREGG